MGRDRDNRPDKGKERTDEEPLNRSTMTEQKVDKTYVKNAHASGVGSIGRSGEAVADDADDEEKIY